MINRWVRHADRMLAFFLAMFPFYSQNFRVGLSCQLKESKER